MSQVQDNTRLYRGQGQVFLGKRVGGKPAGLEFIGNVSELMLNPKTDKIEHMESQTGYNSIDKVIERALKVEMSMTTDSMTKDNLARQVFGKITTEAIASITNEPQIAYAGKNLILDNINLTAFTSLTPSAVATPYILGTDYEVVDLGAGMIKPLVGGAIAATGTAVRANYAIGASETVAAFGSPNVEYWLRFNGLNSAETDNPVVIDCFKVRFAPAADLPVISSDKFAEFKQSGDCLFDAAQPVSGKLGRYFSVRQLVAA
jgi:hypothetical protein